MENTAKKYNNETVDQLLVNDLLKDHLYRSADEIIHQIKFWQARLQSMNDKAAIANTNEIIAKLTSILAARVEINYIVTNAATTAPVTYSPGKPEMKVVKKPTPVDPREKTTFDEINNIIDFLESNKISMKMSDRSAYDELLNIQAYVEIRKEIEGSEKAKDSLDDIFFSANRGIPKAKYTVGLKDYALNPNKDHIELVFYYNNFVRDFPSKFVEKYAINSVEGYLAKVVQDHENVDPDFLKNISNMDRLALSDEIASTLVFNENATVKGMYLKDEMQKIKDALPAMKFYTSLRVSYDIVNWLVNNIETILPKETDTKTATESFEKTKGSTEKAIVVEDDSIVNVVTVDAIVQSLLDGIAIDEKKRDVVDKTIELLFTNEQGHVVESSIVDEVEGSEVKAEVRHINFGKKTQLNDFLYKLYKKVLSEFKMNPGKYRAAVNKEVSEKTAVTTTTEIKDKAVESIAEEKTPTVTSINELVPTAKKLKEAGWTDDAIHKWGVSQVLKKKMEEYSDDKSIIKTEKEANKFIAAMFKGIGSTPPAKTVESEEKSIKAFIEEQVKKDPDIKVSALRERVSFFLEENHIKDDPAALIVLIKQVVPDKFAPKKDEKKEEKKDVIQTPVAWLNRAVEEALNNGVKSAAQLAYKIKSKFKKTYKDIPQELRGDIKELINADDFMDKMKDVFNTNVKDAPGPVKAEEVKTEEPEKVGEKPVEPEAKVEEPKVEIIEKFSTKYPKAWKKVVKYTTLDALLNAAKTIMQKGPDTALSMVIEAIEFGGIPAAKGWTREQAIDWYNKFVNPQEKIEEAELVVDDLEESSTEAKAETTTEGDTKENTNPVVTNALETLSKTNSRGAFRKGLQEVIKENGDSDNLRKQIINMIKNGKGSYVRKIKHNTDADLHAMINKAVKNIKDNN